MALRKISDEEFDSSLTKLHSMEGYELFATGKMLTLYLKNKNDSGALNQKMISKKIPFKFETWLELSKDMEKRCSYSSRIEKGKILEVIDELVVFKHNFCKHVLTNLLFYV